MLVLALVAGAVSVALIGAVLMLHLRADRRAARDRARTATWERGVFRVLAGTTPPEALWQTVPTRDAFLFLDLLLRLSFRVGGAERAQLCALAEPFLPALLPTLAASRSADRARAALLLGTLGTDDDLAIVAVSLHDPSALVAMTAAQTLARRQRVAYGDDLLKVVDRFERWGRNYVASLLAAMGPGFIPALLRLYADTERSSETRAVAAETLRWLNATEAAATAAALLHTEDDREVTAASLRLLRRVGGSEHAATVRPFCTAADPVVRIHAVSALASLGDADDAPRLLMALSDPSQWVALGAARGVRALGGHDDLRRAGALTHPRAALARTVLHEHA
jgi:HEAT repeat protein